MKRIIPSDFYKNKPCSVVAVGCALGIASESALNALKSPFLREDGYLSLKGMNRLIRANAEVLWRRDFKRGSRPVLRDFCHEFKGRAVVCVQGHFVFVNDGDYYSFFYNGNDEVISVWALKS